jgi:hypothetical protein
MDNENFIDTSAPDFAKQFKPTNMDDIFGGDMNDFNDFGYNTEEQPEADNYGDEGEEFEDFDDNEQGQDSSTGNEAFDAYAAWADERGIDISTQGIDKEKFTADDMDKLVGKYYIDKYLGNVDPRITDMADNGVNIDEYMQHKQYLMGIAQTDPVQLYKATMYDNLAKTEANIGTIKLDANGNPTPEAQEYLRSEVERRVAQMNQDEVVARGKQVQEYYKKQANELPERLIEQQKQRYTQEAQRYNTEIDELATLVKKHLEKTDNLVIDFSGQAEKDEFISFMKGSLTLREHEGSQVVPLLYRLQNDQNFLTTTMRLLYMHEKGYFTDLKNTMRNAAFKKLSVEPVIGKNNKTPKSNGGPGNFVDTSTADYQKRFKR